MKLFLIFSLSLLVSSCFKTAEEIRREEQMDQQLQQSSEMVAELTLQVKELQMKLASTSGQIEEIDHKNRTKTEQTAMTFTQTVAQLAEQVKILSEENKQNKIKMNAIETELKEQKDYIQKVNATLIKIAAPQASSAPQAASKGQVDNLTLAHKAFEKDEKDKALKLYLAIINENKITAAQLNHVFHNVGLIYFWKKDYDNALSYFSKIYTKYPKSTWSPRSLLYIARSFKAQGKKEEATVTYQEVIKNYPNTEHAKAAEKELK
jgi:tetratricopeptide (TPR) repeat protein